MFWDLTHGKGMCIFIRVDRTAGLPTDGRLPLLLPLQTHRAGLVPPAFSGRTTRLIRQARARRLRLRMRLKTCAVVCLWK